MRLTNLSALLAAIALTTSPVVALASPTTPTPSTVVAPKAPAATPPTSDADRYAAREAKDPAPAKFVGGDGEITIIGGSTLTLVLIVVILVILL